MVLFTHKHAQCIVNNDQLFSSISEDEYLLYICGRYIFPTISLYIRHSQCNYEPHLWKVMAEHIF